MFDLVRKRYLFFLISLIIIIPGLISLIFSGLRLGIDFTSGSRLELQFAKSGITAPQLNSVLQSAGFTTETQSAQSTGGSATGQKPVWLTFSRVIGNPKDSSDPSNQENADLTKLITDKLGTFKQLSNETIVGHTVLVVQFAQAVTEQQVQKALGGDALKNLSGVVPATPVVGATPHPQGSPAAAPTARAVATPVVKPTAGVAAIAPTAVATPKPLAPLAFTGAQLGDNRVSFLVKVKQALKPAQTATVQENLTTHFGNVVILSNDTVGPSIASDTINRAILAVGIASLAIFLFIWYAFRKVNRPFRYGACAIIALLHDVLVVLGVFSILGWLFGIEIDSLFITAVLTVIGFSVHDTIVVFDRIRENLIKRTTESFETVVNASLIQTLARSLNTSLTVLFTLSALYLLGGVSIRNFTLALLIGIFSGTYSSIFNASMLLVVWENGEWGRFLGRGLSDQRPTREPARA